MPRRNASQPLYSRAQRHRYESRIPGEIVDKYGIDYLLFALSDHSIEQYKKCGRSAMMTYRLKEYCPVCDERELIMASEVYHFWFCRNCDVLLQTATWIGTFYHALGLSLTKRDIPFRSK